VRNELVLDARLMREAIRRNQTYSDAIRRTQMGKELVLYTSPLPPTGASRDSHQRQSAAISGNQRRNHLCRRRELLEILLRRCGVHTQRPSVAVSGAISVIISGNQ